jgi:hypothetical protein
VDLDVHVALGQHSQGEVAHHEVGEQGGAVVQVLPHVLGQQVEDLVLVLHIRVFDVVVEVDAVLPHFDQGIDHTHAPGLDPIEPSGVVE